MFQTQQQRSENYKENMRTFFGATVDLYYERWGDFLHLAIFDQDTEGTETSYETAFELTHQKYWQALDGARAKKILELAAGGGAFTAWMAQRTKDSVVAVDICPRQLQRATDRIKRLQLTNVQLIEHDIMQIDELPEREFDAVVYMDAACYLPNKEAAIKRISKIVNPGARFLLIDWCLPGKPNVLEREMIVDPLCTYWSIPYLETISNYKKILPKHGFKLLQAEDLSSKILKNWKDGYREAVDALSDPLAPQRLAAIAKLTAHYGGLGIEYAKNQFRAVASAYQAAEAGLLRYVMFVSEFQS